jgi:Dolichyl-phosphate-mannose-protein mannosyltransferase
MRASARLSSAGIGAAPARGAARRLSWTRPGHKEVVIALTLLGGVLRFTTLNVSSLDLDESATVILVGRGFGGMLSHLVSSESAPPLYYILVWAWTKIFGAGAVGFRSFSALAGTLTIPVMYLAGRHISARIGVWAAILTTVSPSMYFFSQEARCYALLLLFSAAAFVYWQRALEDPSRRHLTLWSCMSILALLSHYFAVFLFIPEGVVLAARLGWRRMWVAAGAVMLAGLALVPLAAAQRADGKTNWIEGLSLSGRIGESVKMFTVGVYGPLVLYALVLAVLIVAGAVALVWRYGEGRERAGAADAAIIGVSAICLALVPAVAHVIDVYDGRNVIAFWIPFAVLVAAGFGVARAPRAGALLGCALCAISLAMIAAANLIGDYRRNDWRGVGQALGRSASARVIVGELHAAGPLSIYMGPVSSVPARLPPVREVAFFAFRHLRTLGPPEAAVVPTRPPPGFRRASVTRAETFAISRFVAARPTVPARAALVGLSANPKIGATTAEIMLRD